MIDVKIGGVPEHFNLPWYLTLRDKFYQKEGINLRWTDFFGGTGQMAKALRDGTVDLAVILTEGIIRDICNGNPSSIVQVFVKSPLLWGIHVAANSDYSEVSELRGKKAAISRFGSGSHLMAYINAENLGWDTEHDLDFELVRNLEGALENMPKGIGDYFMWEKFTTKPYVDKNIFRRVGECPTPWPCFVIAARNEFIENHPKQLEQILHIINNSTQEFKDIPGIDEIISNRYDQKLEDVREWLSLTEWSQEQLSENVAHNVMISLLQLELIDKPVSTDVILRK